MLSPCCVRDFGFHGKWHQVMVTGNAWTVVGLYLRFVVYILAQCMMVTTNMCGVLKLHPFRSNLMCPSRLSCGTCGINKGGEPTSILKSRHL